ncbi:MAG: hypothetical protein AAF762_09685, partial [Pseudomonadota bacterium]
MKLLLSTIAAAALSAGASYAATVDFADFANGEFVGGPVDLGGGIVGTVTGIPAAGGGAVIYDSAGSGGQDPDLEGPFQNSQDATDIVADFGKALTVQENGSPIPDDTIGFTLNFMFEELLNITSLTFLDSDPGETVTISAPGFAAVEFMGGGDKTFTLADLNFTRV